MIRNAQILEMAKQVKRDQEDWLHKAIMRLLPPKYRAMVERRVVPTSEMMKWAKQNGLQVTFFRDSAMVELYLKGKLIDRFVPQLLVDGRPVDTFKLAHPEQFGDDIWVTGEGPSKN